VSVCPLKILSNLPVFIFHSFTVLSQLPETIYFPFGVTATEVASSVCPLKVRISTSLKLTFINLGFGTALFSTTLGLLLEQAPKNKTCQ
jgi:hypothetical protein